MWQVEYYATSGGRQPVAEWLDSLSMQLRAVIDAKIQKLSENGLLLLKFSKQRCSKSGDEKGFYELRGGQCRIGIYHNKSHGSFVLLHGWLKKKAKQPQDIEHARQLLHDYLSAPGERL